jgi:retinol dehydrogenase-12
MFLQNRLAWRAPRCFESFHESFETLFARTSEEGSQLVVIAASAGKETNGKYMRAGAVQEYAPFITDNAGVKKSSTIWEQLGQRLEKLQPGILQNVNSF